MSETIALTTLVENSVHARGLLAEHGLAFHLQVGSRSLLFDTGQTDVLLHNALKLRISLANAEAIVLSHGHNDHTGGLQAAYEAAGQARLFPFGGWRRLTVPACPRWPNCGLRSQAVARTVRWAQAWSWFADNSCRENARLNYSGRIA